MSFRSPEECIGVAPAAAAGPSTQALPPPRPRTPGRVRSVSSRAQPRPAVAVAPVRSPAFPAAVKHALIPSPLPVVIRSASLKSGASFQKRILIF